MQIFFTFHQSLRGMTNSYFPWRVGVFLRGEVGSQPEEGHPYIFASGFKQMNK